MNNSTYRLSGKNNIISMEKSEEIESNHFISLKLNSTINMKLIMYYEDVLNNWYRQVVNIIYNASNVFEKGNYVGKVKYLVENEEKIEESNINKDVI